MKTRYLLLCLCVCSLLVTACTTESSSFYSAYDKGDCNNTRFDNVDSKLNIDVEWRDDSLYLRWNEYSGDQFDGYYLVKSSGTSDTCPYYFNGADYEKYIGTKSTTYYQDDDITSGETYYYRVCVQKDSKDIDCGGVKRIQVN